MRSLLSSLWQDEGGSVVSAETVLVGTVGIGAATVGMSSLTTSVNDELKDVSRSFRSLDQSYSVQGLQSSTAWTATSAFRQPEVAESLAELDQLEEQLERAPRHAAASRPAETDTERLAREAARRSLEAEEKALEAEFPAAL